MIIEREKKVRKTLRNIYFSSSNQNKSPIINRMTRWNFIFNFDIDKLQILNYLIQ